MPVVLSLGWWPGLWDAASSFTGDGWWQGDVPKRVPDTGVGALLGATVPATAGTHGPRQGALLGNQHPRGPSVTQ